MLKRTLGSYVNEMRLKNDLSLRDLARRTGVSFSYIQNIEKDAVKPSRETLLAVARGLQGALPDEILRLGGYLPDPTLKEEIPRRIQPDLFASRFKESLDQSTWTVDTLSVKTSIDARLIQRWLRDDTYRTSREEVPDVIELYKLANTLQVTPDYLAGYSNHPDEYHPSAPRPKNLRHILASETLVFDHIPLDDKAKEKLTDLIFTVFDDTNEK